MSSNDRTAARYASRYSRQILYHRIGEAGQQKLSQARVAVIGCGALGSASSNLLVRAGVGFTRVVDRDFIEFNNLQRQNLFDEGDIAAELPKAEAAARKLTAINSEVVVEGVVTDVTADSLGPLVVDVDLVIDGTDNLETRFLINDACVRDKRPWIYAACIGSTGMMMPILPGESPCMRCIWPELPPPGSTETCDTAGILGPVVDLVAGWQVMEAIKLLSGNRESVQRRLLQFDAWSGESQWFDMTDARHAQCRCCGEGNFEFLNGSAGSRTVTLCGRNAVQISPAAGARIDFERLAGQIASSGAKSLRYNQFMLRFAVLDREITVFTDGRAVIKGTDSTDEARSLYAKFIGA